jgi:hypothetical protein
MHTIRTTITEPRFYLTGPNSAALRDPSEGSQPTGKPDREPVTLTKVNGKDNFMTTITTTAGHQIPLR